jgi:molybdopterin synthase sulfur carrier subunit
MNCSVKIPTPLRRYTNGASVVKANGEHVHAVLNDLQTQFPGLGERLFDGNGSVKSHLNIFLNTEDIRFLNGDDLSSRVTRLHPTCACGWLQESRTET